MLLLFQCDVLTSHSMYYYVENRKRERRAASAAPGLDDITYDFLDLTDKEHVGFRYVY
jgi:ACS family allantoate permease-like MFS transporter